MLINPVVLVARNNKMISTQNVNHQTHSAPIEVSWYLTKLCNLRCTHCFVYETGETPHHRPTDVNYQEAIKIIDNLANAEIFLLTFLGGDPLMVKWFPDLVLYCQEKGIGTAFSTNGTLLTRTKAEIFSAANVRYIQVSFDGALAATHNAVRGNKQFDDAINALRICKELNITSRIAMTLMTTNIHEIDQLLDLCLKESVTELKLSLFIPTGRGTEQNYLIPDKQAFTNAIYKIKQFEIDNPNRLQVHYPCFTKPFNEVIEWDPTKVAQELSCGAGTSKAIIFEDASVGACDFMTEDRVGDLRKDDFMSIWNGRFIQIEKWRQLHLISGKCGDCGFQAKCGYGCRANAYYSNNDFYGWDSSCIVHEKPTMPIKMA